MRERNREDESKIIEWGRKWVFIEPSRDDATTIVSSMGLFSFLFPCSTSFDTMVPYVKPRSKIANLNSAKKQTPPPVEIQRDFPSCSLFNFNFSFSFTIKTNNLVLSHWLTSNLEGGVHNFSRGMWHQLTKRCFQNMCDIGWWWINDYEY